jgi:hypothetical protein
MDTASFHVTSSILKDPKYTFFLFFSTIVFIEPEARLKVLLSAVAIPFEAVGYCR